MSNWRERRDSKKAAKEKRIDKDSGLYNVWDLILLFIDILLTFPRLIFGFFRIIGRALRNLLDWT